MGNSNPSGRVGSRDGSTIFRKVSSMSAGPLRVGFVGAGTVNFGGSEGPWDHASRLERMQNVKVVGLADALVDKAKQVLKTRQQGPYGELYRQCEVFDGLDEMLAKSKPDVVIIGTPPSCRGSLAKGRDATLTCIKAGVHVFVEKPLSNLPPEEFIKYAQAIEKTRAESKVLVSVGYMFRYHAAVRKMRDIVKENGGVIRALSAVYHVAYSELDRPFWWDCRESGGPIVEQATHLCDIARYLGGEIVEGSVQAICQKSSHGGSELSQLPPGCDVGLPEDERVPRATMATWRFLSGGIGTLCHTVALHGRSYEAYMEVMLDGIRVRLLDPYGPTARLEVRGLAENPEEEQVFHYGDCDPYWEELDAFIQAVRSGDASIVESSYSDAAKTYLFTWGIRYASE